MCYSDVYVHVFYLGKSSVLMRALNEKGYENKAYPPHTNRVLMHVRGAPMSRGLKLFIRLLDF